MLGKRKTYGHKEMMTGTTLEVISEQDSVVRFSLDLGEEYLWTVLTCEEVQELVTQLQAWLSDQVRKGFAHV